MSWFNRLLVSLKLRKPRAEPYRGHVPPWPLPRPMESRDDDTLPFVHRHAVTIPLSQIPPRPRPAPPNHLHAVPSDRDNAMGDPWVPPAGGYGAAASMVDGGEAPAPAPEFKTGTGGDFGGGGADASWGSSDSGCGSGGDSGSSGGCGGSD